MSARIAIALTLIASAFLVSMDAQAGAWASVRMVEGNLNPVVGQLWEATLSVKQHDKRPVYVDRVIARFAHETSGATIEVEGVATGETGHYVIEVLFKEAGIWHWSATPEPFSGTNLPSLEVLQSARESDPAAPTVSLVRGTCADLGSPLGELVLAPLSGDAGLAIAIGITPDRLFITKEIAGGSVAATVHPADDRATLLACGELSLDGVEAPQVVTLQPEHGSGWMGTLTIVPQGSGLVASLTLLPASAPPGVTVRITDGKDGRYDPNSITIPAGTTVTWVNESVNAHTITGTGPGFRNSGMLDPGAGFSQTFDVAGTYAYGCDPHPWMTGTIVVTA